MFTGLVGCSHTLTSVKESDVLTITTTNQSPNLGSADSVSIDSGKALNSNSINIRNLSNAREALDNAIMQSNISKVNEALTSGADTEWTSPVDGETPLTRVSGNIPVAKFLIDIMAKSHLQIPTEGKSNTDIAQALLVAGANPNYPNSYNETPLIRAAAVGNVTLVRLLLSKGADPNLKTDDGKTSVIAAHKYPEIINVLRTAGARG